MRLTTDTLDKDCRVAVFYPPSSYFKDRYVIFANYDRVVDADTVGIEDALFEHKCDAADRTAWGTQGDYLHAEIEKQLDEAPGAILRYEGKYWVRMTDVLQARHHLRELK